MTIEELENKHWNICRYWKGDVNDEDLHTKLSIEFAISVLEYLPINIDDKINELKQYLNEY